LHQGALLVLEEADVAVPDEISGSLPGLRGRHLIRQDAASLVHRLEASEDGRIVTLCPQESAQTFDPVLGSDVRKVNPEDVAEDGVVRRPDCVHVFCQQQFPAAQAVRDVHVTSAVSVQPEREESEPDVVRRDCGHRGPLEAGGLELVDPGIARRDLHVAVERAARVAQQPVGQGLPPRDRVRRSVARDELVWLRNERGAPGMPLVLVAGDVGRHGCPSS
jgi:hypothetical protein